ncbi:ABC transporter permease [Actinokineospora enzanensis]|uniref:ABC transporter permease n=1 Tax=Actinokineospora enzanensis TaxID=155975 RepID=UPI000382EA65|nr:ABC transporter permease [Actinokineospora enzanensis]
MTSAVPTDARWVAADSWTLTRRGLAHWVRNPGQVIFSLAFNIVLVLMFGFLFGGAMAAPGDYREFLIPGMFAMTMLFGIGLTTQAVATDKERGITDRFRSMPVSAASVLIGRAVADLLFAVLTVVVMALCGLAVGWTTHGSPGDTLVAFLLILLLRFALIWVGVYIGLSVSGQEAITGVQTLEFPLGFLSCAFVAPSTMPTWLGTVADWNPLSSTVVATRQLFGNPGWTADNWIVRHADLMAVCWPVLITAVFMPLAIGKFRALGN